MKVTFNTDILRVFSEPSNPRKLGYSTRRNYDIKKNLVKLGLIAFSHLEETGRGAPSHIYRLTSFGELVLNHLDELDKKRD